MVQFKVFKKPSPNGKLTLYMARRDFVDHVTDVDPVDGVIVVDPAYLQGRHVYGQLVCCFRYGSEADEVMGLCFQKDLYLASERIYPPAEEGSTACLKDAGRTRTQDTMIKRIGGHAFPFTFVMPRNAPPSVTIHPGAADEGKPCGVEYFVKVFVGESEEDRSHKRSTVTLNIRRVQFAPSKQDRQPCTIVRKDFMLSPGELELEVNLDKQLYYHNENIAVYISIRNHSNKTVKKVKASVQQSTDVCLFNGGQYRCTVARIETQEGCPVTPGATLQKALQLHLSLDANRDRRGVAIDGRLKNKRANLASSTLIHTPEDRNAFGIIVSYAVRVKLYLGAVAGEVTAELPFVLMHPKPDLRRMVRADSHATVEAFRSESFGASLDMETQEEEGERVGVMAQ